MQETHLWNIQIQSLPEQSIAQKNAGITAHHVVD